VFAGDEVALLPLATSVAGRYFERYPEDLERYGDVARQWEIHDTQHLLNWAIGDVEGHVDLERQVGWLAGVLEARDFPLEHLAGNLELAADTVEAELEGAQALAGRLRDAAAHVRGAETFLE
jgi:hypothetical protein